MGRQYHLIRIDKIRVALGFFILYKNILFISDTDALIGFKKQQILPYLEKLHLRLEGGF